MLCGLLITSATKGWEVTDEPMWTVEEAAAFLGQSREHVRRRLASGDIVGRRISGRGKPWRVYAEALKQRARADEALARIAQRKADGMVAGYSDFAEKMEAVHGPSAGEHAGNAMERWDLLNSLATQLLGDAGVARAFADLDDQQASRDAIEEAAHACGRHAELVRRRAREILEDEGLESNE
jgi:excisionase family DNA binding protein